MARLQEIEERLSAIKAEMNTEGANLDALGTEVDNLIAERTRLLGEIETRRGILDKIGSGAAGEGAPVIPTEEKRSFDTSSPEYRSAFLKNLRNLELTEVEKRAFSSGSSSAGAVIPTNTANEIIKKLKQHAPLLGEITLLNVSGNVKFAVENAKADAAIHTENATITAGTDTFTTVTLTSYEIVKLVQVSETVKTMSIDIFESWLTDMIAEKVAEKIGAFLISGTGSEQPAGVGSAATWGDTNSVTVTKTGALSAANVQALIGLLDGVYDANAKFLMSKRTLFTDFMPLQDNSKNKIVTVEGHNYYVYGYPVMLDDNVTVHEAYLGDFKKIVGNLSQNITVKSDFDITTNSYRYLGVAMFDSKIADSEAFVKLVKATA